MHRLGVWVAKAFNSSWYGLRCCATPLPSIQLLGFSPLPPFSTPSSILSLSCSFIPHLFLLCSFVDRSSYIQHEQTIRTYMYAVSKKRHIWYKKISMACNFFKEAGIQKGKSPMDYVETAIMFSAIKFRIMFPRLCSTQSCTQIRVCSNREIPVSSSGDSSFPKKHGRFQFS